MLCAGPREVPMKPTAAIALFTLGLVCGATPVEAAEIANHASAVVVSKLGTATVSRDELIASFRQEHANE